MQLFMHIMQIFTLLVIIVGSIAIGLVVGHRIRNRKNNSDSRQ